MALLNLSASYAVGEALTEAVLEQSAEKVLAMRRDLQETFRLRFREDPVSKKDKKCRALEVVNQVLGRWGFTQIRLGFRKKKTIDGKRCNVDSTYNLVETCVPAQTQRLARAFVLRTCKQHCCQRGRL